MLHMVHEGYAYTGSTADLFEFSGVSFGIAIPLIYVLVGGMRNLGNICILVDSNSARLHFYAGSMYACMGGLEQLFLGSSFGQDWDGYLEDVLGYSIMAGGQFGIPPSLLYHFGHWIWSFSAFLWIFMACSIRCIRWPKWECNLDIVSTVLNSSRFQI